MRTNPLADRIRDRLQPQWVTFADPFHPDRVLVARQGRDGQPEQNRVVATIERRGELDLFNPIFRHPPASPDQWQKDWENGTLVRLADAGGREGRYYCARMELPPGEVPKDLSRPSRLPHPVNGWSRSSSSAMSARSDEMALASSPPLSS